MHTASHNTLCSGHLAKRNSARKLCSLEMDGDPGAALPFQGWAGAAFTQQLCLGAAATAGCGVNARNPHGRHCQATSLGSGKGVPGCADGTTEAQRPGLTESPHVPFLPVFTNSVVTFLPSFLEGAPHSVYVWLTLHYGCLPVKCHQHSGLRYIYFLFPEPNTCAERFIKSTWTLSSWLSFYTFIGCFVIRKASMSNSRIAETGVIYLFYTRSYLSVI